MAKRSQYSIRRSLIEKAKEVTLTAVQAYNNPLTRFKSEPGLSSGSLEPLRSQLCCDCRR